MAWKRYTAEEIINQLRTVEIETAKGIGIVDACRKLGITEQFRYDFLDGELFYTGGFKFQVQWVNDDAAA